MLPCGYFMRRNQETLSPNMQRSAGCSYQSRRARNEEVEKMMIVVGEESEKTAKAPATWVRLPSLSFIGMVDVSGLPC